jgi:DNA-binding MarR family transcriptional regulator
MCSSIVFSPNCGNYRKLAQKHYSLTDEQMIGMDVHHNPPKCKGGRNIPEHLYVYHPELHAQIHEKESILWARKGYEIRIKNGTENKKGISTGGGICKKTNPTQEEIAILKYRQSGLSRKEVADLLGLKEHQVKRAITECSKFGYILHLKSGPKKGCEGREQSEETKQIIREKRALQVFTEDTQKKKSDKMKGKKWWNDGCGNCKRSVESPGENWVSGRKPRN